MHEKPEGPELPHRTPPGSCDEMLLQFDVSSECLQLSEARVGAYYIGNHAVLEPTDHRNSVPVAKALEREKRRSIRQGAGLVPEEQPTGQGCCVRANGRNGHRTIRPAIFNNTRCGQAARLGTLHKLLYPCLVESCYGAGGEQRRY